MTNKIIALRITGIYDWDQCDGTIDQCEIIWDNKRLM